MKTLSWALLGGVLTSLAIGCGGSQFVDADGDGVSSAGDDCDDADPNVRPGAEDVPYDGIDQDCTGADLTDKDHDGHPAAAAAGDDCDDDNPAVHPGAGEACDGIDNDCDGEADEGFGALTCGVGACRVTVSACENGAPQVCSPLPAGQESCNGLDDDCNGEVDEGCACTDGASQACYGGSAGTRGVGACQDGSQTCAGGAWGSCAGEVQPSAETCNSVDDDCDGVVDDLGTQSCGVGACEVTVPVCVNGSPQTCTPGTPGAETCNGEDDDCNGLVDDGLGYTTCGVGECATTVANCLGGVEQTCTPGASSTEVCNGVDDDCDGQTDEEIAPLTCGVGACARTEIACVAGTTQTCTPGTPGTEVCNGIDDDCDTLVDEGPGGTYYRDVDADGFGDPNDTVDTCSPPPGYVADGGDCDDGDPGVNPGAAELCNAIDDDCDTLVDEGTGGTYYRDADADGFGDPNDTVATCSPPPGYVADGGDCDDGNPAVNPGGVEVCNGIDDDCDAQIDEGAGSTYYRDVDGDGFGNPSVTVKACSRPTGYAASGTDCDDLNVTVNPGAPEIAGNGIDDNCNGMIDEP